MQKTIKKHLSSARLMQLATISGDKPWVVTVYFVVDSSLNVYWLSWPDRQHSQNIKNNPKASGTFVIKPERPVIGISVEGRASNVSDYKNINTVMNLYINKYNEGRDFHNNFINGTNKHNLYCLMPKKFTIFDEVSNIKNPKQEWLL
ncbi:pyridoxamine 5'-phosphate oxidase family protein [Candidatus Saccharibacteria bacterium]|nr:pyridoxamine 5'-phosphate oxidase family protein [Candidatus Saccharibacteria bacterium]